MPLNTSTNTRKTKFSFDINFKSAEFVQWIFFTAISDKNGYDMDMC